MGSLAIARHDFRAGLRYGERARPPRPASSPYGVIVDALVELGRYDAAERTLQRMVDLKPNLASYARVSYFRELHGDLAGAVEAMRLAVSAGGDAPENVAYVQTLLGNLELARGRTADAERAYRLALSRYPDYVPAAAGLARVDASRGELARRSAATAPSSPSAAAARVRDRAGRGASWPRGAAPPRARPRAGAGASSACCARRREPRRRDGVFEADHGIAARAVDLARRGWAAAPSVRSADALGWALTRAGRPAEGLEYAQRALRLGSRDASCLYHAGIAAHDAGERDAAARYLTRALAGGALAPLHRREARTALRELP